MKHLTKISVVAAEDKQSVNVAPLEFEGGEQPEITEDKLEKKEEDVKKEDEKKEEGEGHVAWKAYLGAAGAAVGLGLADYLASLLAKLALKGVWAEWFGCLVAWLTYHLYCYIEFQCKKESPDTEYMTKATSMYYEVVQPEETEASAVVPSDQETGKDDAKKEYRFSRIKTCGMISRFVFQLGIQLSLLTTFYFGSRSGVNNGIISTIFSTGVIFTALIFFCVYGQKLSCYDIIGALGITACVVLISVGGAGKSEEHGAGHVEEAGGHGPDLSKGLSDEEKSFNLMLAIISATVTGLVFALNSLSIQFCTSIGCGVSQANMDAMLVMFLVLLPGFLVTVYTEVQEEGAPFIYGWTEMIIATAILVTQVFGIISLSIGLKYGSAGPVQAIENQKTTIQTLLEAAVNGKMPFPIQWGGLACGIVGVTVIVCQPKKESPKAEENQIEPSEGNEVPKEEKANEVK